MVEDKNRRNILILDPEQDTAELFSRALETNTSGWKCYWVKTCLEARSLMSEMPFFILLADLSILEEDHFLLLDTIRKVSSATRVIVDAYLNQKEDIVKMREKGAAGYFIKPVKVSALRRLIDDIGNDESVESSAAPVISR